MTVFFCKTAVCANKPGKPAYKKAFKKRGNNRAFMLS